MRVFTVFDKVARSYSAPMLAKNDDEAGRMFQLSVQNLSYCEDYVLFDIGFFDPETGELKGTGLVEKPFVVVYKELKQ